jgi:hypothetical protein
MVLVVNELRPRICHSDGLSHSLRVLKFSSGRLQRVALPRAADDDFTKSMCRCSTRRQATYTTATLKVPEDVPQEKLSVDSLLGRGRRTGILNTIPLSAMSFETSFAVGQSSSLSASLLYANVHVVLTV